MPIARRPTPTLAERVRAADRLPLYLLGVLMAGELALLLYLGRGTTFFYDEWDFVQGEFGGGLHSLLVPHNEHLSIVPIAIYKLLFHVVGLRHYQLYRLVLIGSHLACAGLVFVLATRRLGRWEALIPAALLLLLGTAWDDLLWPFQIGFLGSIVGGLGAWALLDLDRTEADVGACAALALSVASSGLGIAFAVGVAAELAWRRSWWRLWLPAIPLALFVLWYSRYGMSRATLDNAVHAPAWVADAVAAAFAAIIGQGLDWGRPLALAALLAVPLVLRRRLVSPRLVGALVTGFAFWTLTAISRATTEAPATSRYLYLGAVVVLLAAVEALRGVRASNRAIGLGAVGVLISALGGLTTLHDGSRMLRLTSRVVTAELGALQLERAHAAPGFQPDPQRAPQIKAGTFFHAVRAIGSSPADSPGQIARSGSQARAAADAVLLALLAPAPEAAPSSRPASGGPAPVVEGVQSAAVSTHGACVTAAPQRAGVPTTVTVTLPAHGVLVGDSVTQAVGLELRRFGDSFTPLGSTVPGHRSATLVVPADASPAPWHLQVGVPGAVSVCRLGP